MRPKSLILLALALGCGLVASIGISQVMDRNKQAGGPAVATEAIYVANSDVNVNEALTADLLKLEEWPLDKIPHDAVRTLEEIEGRRPAAKVFQGEPIRLGRLIGANEGASSELPPGYRPFPIRVDATNGNAFLIKPGDKVDVQLFLKRNLQAGIEETKTATVMKDIRVFAIDQFYRRASDQEEPGAAYSTVSLVVTPDQANKLSLASRIGELSLLLRNPDDTYADTDTDEVTLADLLEPEKGNRSKERESVESPQNLELLKQLEALRREKEQLAGQLAAGPALLPFGQTHKLVILRGGDAEVVEFPADGGLPSPSGNRSTGNIGLPGAGFSGGAPTGPVDEVNNPENVDVPENFESLDEGMNFGGEQ